MPDSRRVDPQTSDAAAQANDPAAAHAAGISIGSLYAAIAQSISIAMQNAVAAQQALESLRNSSTIEGIHLLYEADHPSSVPYVESLGATPKNDEVSGAEAAKQAFEQAIAQAIELANANAAQHAGEFAYALRTLADAAMAAIDAIGRAHRRNAVRTLQTAAIAACMAAMIRHPENADEYANVLQSIREFGD
jgi:hypothetical protein